MKEEPRYFETLRPLSRSSIWRFMRAFYDRRGLTAWTESTVPSQISNHAGLAFTYAKLAAAWLDDLRTADAVTLGQTVYALELGAGTGRLGYGFLRHYEHARRALGLPRICYVLSDFTETNVEAHRKNPALRQLAADGLVDFCVFDASKPRVPILLEARKGLMELVDKSALLVVANYLFDSLPHDFFKVDKQVLQDGLVSLSSKDGHEPEYKFREQIEDVKLHFAYARADRPRYNEPLLDRLLDFYRDFDHASFLFPAMGLCCIDSLRAMSKGRMLLLTGDKAVTHIEELMGDKEPFVAHHGSFSVTANYHVLSLYAEMQKGRALLPPPRDGSLTYCVLRFDDRQVPTKRLERAFDEAMVQMSPTDWHTISWHLADAPQKLEYYLALLRTTGCDPVMLVRFEKAMLPLAKDASYRHVDEVVAIVERAADVYLHVRHDDEFLPAAARLLIAFKAEPALVSFAHLMESRFAPKVQMTTIVQSARAALQPKEAP